MFETGEPRRCRVCGCTESTACWDHQVAPTHWNEDDLCGLCVDEPVRPQWGLFVAGVAAGVVVLGAAQAVMAVLS